MSEKVLRKGFDEPAHVGEVDSLNGLHQHVGKVHDRIPNDVGALSVRGQRTIRFAQVGNHHVFAALQFHGQGRARFIGVRCNCRLCRSAAHDDETDVARARIRVGRPRCLLKADLRLVGQLRDRDGTSKPCGFDVLREILAEGLEKKR